jgi:hypothetical protein
VRRCRNRPVARGRAFAASDHTAGVEVGRLCGRLAVGRAALRRA